MRRTFIILAFVSTASTLVWLAVAEVYRARQPPRRPADEFYMTVQAVTATADGGQDLALRNVRGPDPRVVHVPPDARVGRRGGGAKDLRPGQIVSVWLDPPQGVSPAGASPPTATFVVIETDPPAGSEG
jgi:hypothetical protein